MARENSVTCPCTHSLWVQADVAGTAGNGRRCKMLATMGGGGGTSQVSGDKDSPSSTFSVPKGNLHVVRKASKGMSSRDCLADVQQWSADISCCTSWSFWEALCTSLGSLWTLPVLAPARRAGGSAACREEGRV